MLKRFIYLLAVLSLGILLAACQQRITTEKDELRVGTISGPETQLMEVAKEVAAKNGVKITIVEFNDYSMPNAALNDGSIDANVFQHEPYLEEMIKNRGYRIVSIGKTFIYPMGIYSQKYKNLTQLPEQATVAIPNDPSNEARALLLLAQAGLITLKSTTQLDITLRDVANNPKRIIFKTLDAAQLSRVLPDVDLAVINTNYAIPAGLTPSRDALYRENNHSPYANVIAIRTEDKDNPKFTALLTALHSPEVLKKAEHLFKGQAIPAWTK